MADLITILGPTASGKTSLATAFAYQNQGEVISADSRQVYRGMDIGTGKDLGEYVVNGQHIPYHLIDIHEPGYEYNVFEFQEDFYKVYKDIQLRKNQPILCGGTGLYIDAVLKGYKLLPVPPNDELRQELELVEHEELIERLRGVQHLHNSTDTSSKKRTIRALEIALYCKENDVQPFQYPKMSSVVFGITVERAIVKERITNRLKQRIEEGMVEEVEGLLARGISIEKLKFYGLEYKYIAQFLNKEISFLEMFKLLNTAIHQFSKRQMTWFRRMEKQGTTIHWLDGKLSNEEKIAQMKEVLAL